MQLNALQEVAQIAADWLWETDANHKFTCVSPSAAAFLGCDAQDLIGLTYNSITFVGGAVSPISSFEHLLRAQRAFRDAILTYDHPDGAPRWFEISGRPLVSPENEFLGFRGVGSDVSDQHRTRDALVTALAKLQDANAALIEQNRRFDAALENMTQGLCLFDADHRLVVWNQSYLEIFGLAETDLMRGMSQRAIIAHLVALNCYKPGATVDSLSEGTRTSLGREGSKSVLRELADGRVVAATHRPMTGGGWVATFEDVTERRRNEDRIIHMARHDALTSLPNRMALTETGAAMLATLEQGSDQLAVFCLDLDRFKPVNDFYGHSAGDALLRGVAERLRGHTRTRDVVARLGGDEFAILCHVDDASSALMLAQRLIEVVSRPYVLDHITVEVGMSVGIALIENRTRDMDRLLKDADMALYEAKAGGRGSARLFELQMDETIRARASLERELREALVAGEFELHYQPLVNLADDCIIGFEALVRWRQPEHGLISPAAFIQIAEETGLIVPLGAWVLNQACRDAMKWPGSINVAVNVSPIQLRQRGFVTEVMAALTSSGLKAVRLELEITESVLLEDTEINLEILHTLRRLGIRICMDDFGTGYSSISYLRRFPFDKIKIDRSFVRDEGGRADSSAIIRAIVGLGVSLGVTTLVEGVETEAQLATVRAEGAQQMQGFVFSKPRPAHEVLELLADRNCWAGRVPCGGGDDGWLSAIAG